MKPFVSVSVALALANLPAAAIAQVAQTYSYDGNGRLTTVGTTSSTGTHSSTYTYDDADNRTARSQTGTGSYAALSRLDAGDGLLPDQALVSEDGRFTFALRPSGDLELRLGDDLLWSSPAGSETGSPFRLDVDGVARLDPDGPIPLDTTGAFFAVQNDGDLVLNDGTGTSVLWRSNTCCH